MNKNYKISVVIISYNQGQYLEETINSVINQSYHNKEIILIDGGSSDNSIDIIKKYSDKFYYWISEPDNGQSDALIKGFDKCTGDLIGWINSDDLLLPEALQAIINKANKVGNCNGVFYGGFYFVDTNGKPQEKFKNNKFNYFISKTLGPNISQPGTFFSKKAYENIGGLNTTFSYAMDLDLFCNFLFNDYPFYYTGKFHAEFRKHSFQKGHSLEYLQQCEMESEIINEKYGFNKTSKSRKRVARLLQILIRIFNGYYLQIILFRLKQRKTISQFKTTYSD